MSIASNDDMRIKQLEQQVKILTDRNMALMGQSECLTELPLIMNLFKIFKAKSFIDKKLCLNECCALQFHSSIPNYYSEVKLVLSKSDSEVKAKCSKCGNHRNCAMYECKHCEQQFCYYCLIDHSKRMLIQNLISNQPEVHHRAKRTQKVAEISALPEIKSEQPSQVVEQKKDIVLKNFGKYSDQYLEFMSWPINPSFFTTKEQWQNIHYKVDQYDYLEQSHNAPKIHQPDRLELELVSIRKLNNYIYEGQVIVNTQNFHGFGRIMQWLGGQDNTGNCYVYEGWFINGLPQGWGRKIEYDGTSFIGKFRFGLEDGEGVRVFKEQDEEHE